MVRAARCVNRHGAAGEPKKHQNENIAAFFLVPNMYTSA